MKTKISSILAPVSSLCVALACACAATNASAEVKAGDPGDPPHLKRYEGSKIFAVETSEYLTYNFLAGKVSPSADFTKRVYAKEEAVKGKLERYGYFIPDKKRTVQEVHENYLEELEKDGWEIMFSGMGEKELGNNFGTDTTVKQAITDTQFFIYALESVAYIAARRSDPTGDVYVTVWINKHDNGLVGKYKEVQKDMLVVKLDVIKPRNREQKMVFVDAAKMKQDIDGSGRVALYGITFDFNKTDVKPESKPTLDEIAKFLKAEPKLNVLVVGHTDNVGTLEFNQDLSSRRAASVVQELVKNYGIAASRLKASGVAFLCPVAPNATEEGRAKNRRVELVPF